MNAETITQTPLLVLVGREAHARIMADKGFKNIEVLDLLRGGEQVCTAKTGELKFGFVFDNYLLCLPREFADLRDDVAMRLGDEKCKWFDWPDDGDAEAALLAARPMWVDEIATMDDVPEPGPEQVYKSGLPSLDLHGFRFVLPSFMSIVGPYGSGKSVLLRQLLCNLNRLHGWKCLLTSFEEKVKPRFQRDLRRHFLGMPIAEATNSELALADAAIRKGFVFLRRKRNTVLDMDRLLDRLEFAVRVYGVKVVAIDPVNEVDHNVPKGEAKTDYMGRFIMRLKALADDYGLLVICCLHPPKDGVEKRLQKHGLLTLNDGADTAHWGNKSDVGWCVWRDFEGPTLLHIDKLKDHETMGKPTVAEMELNSLGSFQVTRIGYDILREGGDERK